MKTMFHYVPLSPEPISGAAVLRQTEQAINELGDRVDLSGRDADEAIRVAKAAQASVEAASSAADYAFSTAQNAQTTATNAQASANMALTNAQTAQATAETLADTANAARSTAELAQAAVAQAQDALSLTNQNLDNLIGVVSANARELERMTVVQAIDTDSVSVDLNECFAKSDRLYLTGSGVLNAPVEITTPLWFEVLVTDDGQTVSQKCETATADAAFTRIGIVDDSEPENTLVMWSDWQDCSAGGTEPVVTWLPVSFDPLNENPVRTVIPADVNTASLVALESDAETTGVTLTLRLSFGNAAAVIPAAPEQVDVSAFRGRSVDIVFTGLPDTADGAAALIRLE